jgi:CheY-like chemotaxis protein
MVWVRCNSCRALIFCERDGPLVLVAHNVDPIAQTIGVTLIDAGFAPIRVERGREALRVLERERPPVAVLDVALTDTMSFEVVDAIRRSEALRSTKVILVASVFNRTAYKRRPETLHGADAYVEQHHITDMLPTRIAALLGTPPPATRCLESGARQTILDGEARTELAGAERVGALARSIAADIALYHESELREVAAGGESDAVAAALVEGRALLSRMVNDGEVTGDPLAVALAEVARSVGGGGE